MSRQNDRDYRKNHIDHRRPHNYSRNDKRRDKFDFSDDERGEKKRV